LCIPNRVIAAHGHAQLSRPTPSVSPKHLAVHNMLGPLGLSLAPYVRSSRTLSKWFKPIANWYANLSGYRKVGLVYDDLRASPNLPSPCQTPRTTSLSWCLPHVAPNAHVFFAQSLRSVQMSKG
jgi:hypothetical protein